MIGFEKHFKSFHQPRNEADVLLWDNDGQSERAKNEQCYREKRRDEYRLRQRLLGIDHRIAVDGCDFYT